MRIFLYILYFDNSILIFKINKGGVTKFLSHLPFPNKLCSRNSFFENKLKFHKNLRSNFRTFLLLS
ncbi:hypothetical protein FZB77_01670 [Enterococcus faecium]|nr:hypothetical protein [Enterococcus faecium]MCZ1300013.1 hypothetical protein [Enterococcus faecium]MCZ1311862.1 hypothetical protein [Enterococcus faecium]MCZ1317033.1 hypothetical protein [Enterococcus faecium]MCZ1437285.1 hypothetical protein [Enterococcus faecium]